MTLPPGVVSSKRGAYRPAAQGSIYSVGAAGRDANVWYLVPGLLSKNSLVNEPHHSSSVLETQTVTWKPPWAACCGKGGEVFTANELSIIFSAP